MESKNLSNTLPQSKKRIDALFVLKGLCAFLVVANHTPLGNNALYLEAFNAVAVPLFFMISGYFLYDDNPYVVVSRCFKSIKKIIPIILILQVIYYPFAPMPGGIKECWALYARLVFLGFHYFKTIHLWYLTALLEGLLFLAVYIKFFKGKKVAPLVLFVITGLLLGRYRFLFGEVSSLLVFNAISYAIPFLAMGYIIKQYEDRIRSYKHWLDSLVS